MSEKEHAEKRANLAKHAQSRKGVGLCSNCGQSKPRTGSDGAQNFTNHMWQMRLSKPGGVVCKECTAARDLPQCRLCKERKPKNGSGGAQLYTDHMWKKRIRTPDDVVCVACSEAKRARHA